MTITDTKAKLHAIIKQKEEELVPLLNRRLTVTSALNELHQRAKLNNADIELAQKNGQVNDLSDALLKDAAIASAIGKGNLILNDLNDRITTTEDCINEAQQQLGILS